MNSKIALWQSIFITARGIGAEQAGKIDDSVVAVWFANCAVILMCNSRCGCKIIKSLKNETAQTL